MKKEFQPVILAISFAFLLIGAYIDNSRGPLLPVITRSLGLQYSESSLFIVAGNMLAIPATFMLLPLLNRFGLKKIIGVILLMAIVLPFIGMSVTNLLGLLGFGAFLGVGISAMGSLCNIMAVLSVPPSWRSRVLAALHSTYGIGSFLAAVGVNNVMGLGLNWAHVFTVPAVLSAAAAFFIPGIRVEVADGAKPTGGIFLVGREWLVVFIFCVYVMGEVGCTIWLVTYLSESQGMSIPMASKILGALFLLMSLTRVAAFFGIKEEHELFWAIGSLIFAAIFFAMGIWVSPYCFALVGCFGPFFPIVMGRSSRLYHQRWQSVMIWIVVGLQVGLALVHLAIGRTIDILGVEDGFLLPLFFLIFTAILLEYWRRMELRLAEGGAQDWT